MSLLASSSRKRKHHSEDDDELSSKRIKSPTGRPIAVEQQSKLVRWLQLPILSLLKSLRPSSLSPPKSLMDARARGLLDQTPSPPPLPPLALAAPPHSDPPSAASLPSPAPSRSTSPVVATSGLPSAGPRLAKSLSEPFSSHASSSKHTLNTPPSPPSSSASSHRHARDSNVARQPPSKLKLAPPADRERTWLPRAGGIDLPRGWASPQDDSQSTPSRTASVTRPKSKKTPEDRRKRLADHLTALGRSREMHLDAYRAKHRNNPDALASVDEASFSELQQLLARQKTDWKPRKIQPSINSAPPPSSPRATTLKDALATSPAPSVFDALYRSLNVSQRSRKDSRREPTHMPEMESLKIRDEDADRKIAERLAKLAPKLPAKLTDAQEAEVEALYEKGRAHVSRCNREQVTYSDLERLRPRQWANDEIMNYYGTMIQDAADARVALAAEGKMPKDEALSLHYFSTFFFAKLESPGYEKAKLSRWTKKIDLFKKDLVLIPINQGNAHWTSAVINFKHKRIEAYDSMGEGSAQSIFEKLKGYLQSESMDKKKVPFDFAGWEMYTDYKTTPQQLNGYDCGIFSCQVLESVSRGQGYGKWTFGQENMLYLRRRMMLEISRAKLLNHPASAP